ncbi:VOC family protein [Salsipaludibacter albus]|uniref:VOC family protein n=1 Tax=Salsipaludibacter albus TaxID=2849650 RepID=UPI001EE46F3D|nr:VOC family protein [Salsipaludibacter albus]MBY5162456.1 VOC family protein [Salsipaludibacter albus]
MTHPTLSAICIDCQDASSTAAFWAALLDGEVTHDADGVAAVEAPGATLYFDEVEGFTSPGWPADTKQFHLDLQGPDPSSFADRVVELGGSVPDFQPGEERWTVYLDPAGHPFCISAG